MTARRMLGIASIFTMLLVLGSTPTRAKPKLVFTVAAPSGLAVVLDTATFADPSWKRAVANQYMAGVALQIHWSDLEPAQDKPDWSKLDELFAEANAHHKWVALLVFPGFFTPSWALQGVETRNFPIQYGPGHGTVLPLPMPWDQVYLNRWFAFVRLVSARYASGNQLTMISAVGPTSVSAEFTLPNSPQDLKTWQSVGYRPSKYLAAWRQVFHEYNKDFPRQYVSLSSGAGLDINEQGQIDHSEHLATRQKVVDAGMHVLGSRFVLQMSDVHAGPGPHDLNSDAEDQFIIGYNGRIVTGLQMRSSAIGAPRVMGDAQNPSLALRKSVDLATEKNATGVRINYLEIYSPDVLADEMQPVLQYAASLFAQPPPK
jgi:hypothetical protein